MGTGLTPSQIVFGEGDFFSSIENGLIRPIGVLDSLETRYQVHLAAIMEGRHEMIKYEAARIIRLSLTRNIRDGVTKVPEIGSRMRILLNNKWVGGWGMIGVISSNALVGCGGILRKIPATHMRMSNIEYDESLHMPNVNSDLDPSTQGQGGK